MANKPMGMFNIGSDTYEVVDIAGRQATEAVDEKADEIELTVSQLSASNLSYDNDTSIKQKIDVVDNSVKIKNCTALTNSDFTWDDVLKCFISRKTIQNIIGTKTLLGFSAWFTNGGAIANARYNGSDQKIHVEGWISSAGAPINSNYLFTVLIYTN